MSKTKKALIGVSTFVPFLLLIIMFSVFMFEAVNNPEGEPPAIIIVGLIGVYALLLITGIINIIIYISHIVKNNKMADSEKTIWLCLLFFFNILVMAIYYFVHIIPNKPPAEEPVTLV